MKPIYFDMTVNDLAAARDFFAAVLGWTFERFPMPYEYYRITAGAPSEPGIDGGMGAGADAVVGGGRPMTQVTVPVTGLDRRLADVAAHGGKVVEPRTAIPGVGWYATCAEPGGLLFGMIEVDPTAA